MSSEASEDSRPLTLAEVAANSSTGAEFALCLQNFLRVLRERSTRAAIRAAIVDPPPLLAERFTGGDLADARLAAHARLIARFARIETPQWATSPQRLQSSARAESSVADIVTPHEITLGIRRGRPLLGEEHKRQTNAERQRRFRARRAAEWRLLNRVVERERPKPVLPPAPESADITLDLRELP